MYHDPDHVPWEEAVHVASCSEGHDAPAPGCRCGIYGAVEGVLDSLPGYLHDTAYEHDPFAYGEIACTGRVCVDMRGVRAERGEILRLALADAVDDGLRARLSARYGVPVGGAESVPDWVTVNARDRGAPPDDVDLALDLDRLDDAETACRRARADDDDPDHDVYHQHALIEIEARREHWRRALDLAVDATRVDRLGRTTDILAFVIAQVFGEADRPVPEPEEFQQVLAASRAEHRRLHLEDVGL